jgi:hypothetical protein
LPVVVEFCFSLAGGQQTCWQQPGWQQQHTQQQVMLPQPMGPAAAGELVCPSVMVHRPFKVMENKRRRASGAL